MADQLGIIAKQFIDGLHSDKTKEVFEHLNLLVEQLESKDDPEPTEIRLMSELYDFIEKLNHVQHNLKALVSEKNETAGSKLTSIYEDMESNGGIYRD